MVDIFADSEASENQAEKNINDMGESTDFYISNDLTKIIDDKLAENSVLLMQIRKAPDIINDEIKDMIDSLLEGVRQNTMTIDTLILEEIDNVIPKQDEAILINVHAKLLGAKFSKKFILPPKSKDF